MDNLILLVFVALVAPGISKRAREFRRLKRQVSQGGDHV